MPPNLLFRQLIHSGPRLLLGLLVFLAGLRCAAPAWAQDDTLRVAERRLQPASLRPGLRQYLVYLQNPAAPKKLRLWRWLRDVHPTAYHGAPAVEVPQHWYGSDTTLYRTIRSLNRAADFAPLYHRETVAGKTRAYNWSSSQVERADSVPGNQAGAAVLALRAPSFNGNLDIETLEQLPLAAGKAFVIYFLDAGQATPVYHRYQVVGRETLTLLDHRRVACWKLIAAGTLPDGTSYTQTFWLSRRGHEFLREVDHYGQQLYRYKVKLPAAAPDVRPRFLLNST